MTRCWSTSASYDEIPIDELLILYGDELILDGSDPSTYIVLESGACLADTLETLGWTSPDAGADAEDADGCSGPGGSSGGVCDP